MAGRTCRSVPSRTCRPTANRHFGNRKSAGCHNSSRDVGDTKPSESGIRVHLVLDDDDDDNTHVGQCETNEAGKRSLGNVAALVSSTNWRGSDGGVGEEQKLVTGVMQMDQQKSTKRKRSMLEWAQLSRRE